MAKLQTATRKKRRKIKRRRKPDESESGAAMYSAGLGMLQQSVGNRAVQRLLTEDASKVEPQAAKVQRQEEDESQTETQQDEGSSAEMATVTEADIEETGDEDLPAVLSDVELLDEFEVSDKLEDLDADFRENVENLIEALEEGGASVEILATAWSPERAYLMHFAWLIANGEIDPRQVPTIDAIEFEGDADPETNINWWHGSVEASIEAAQAIVEACEIGNLDEAPNLLSHHVTGQAIDMKVSWGGKEFFLEDPMGEAFIIAGGSSNETNPALIDFAAAYGVVHYGEVDADPVHWSVDGQ